jgi:hypothetical protein
MAAPNAGDVKRLEEVRHALLRLHKALLDAQRTHYERTHGRVASSGQFLQVVISDPAFDWLHRFSELIVEIDEATDADEPLSQAQTTALLEQARALLQAGQNEKYTDTLQSDANAAMLHQELTQLLHRA